MDRNRLYRKFFLKTRKNKRWEMRWRVRFIGGNFLHKIITRAKHMLVSSKVNPFVFFSFRKLSGLKGKGSFVYDFKTTWSKCHPVTQSTICQLTLNGNIFNLTRNKVCLYEWVYIVDVFNQNFRWDFF